MLENEGRIIHEGLNSKFICQQFEYRSNIITEDNILFQNGEEFIKACYLFFFGREAEEEGLRAHVELLNLGLSKEGFLYYFSKTKEFHHRFPLKNINFYKKEYLKYQWDIGSVLQYNGWKFIEHCYMDLLERKPDEDGMYQYSKMLATGMPKEAIVYLFISSEEIKQVKGIKNVEAYKRVYDDYIGYSNRSGLKKWIKNCLERLTNKKQIYSEQQANHAVAMMRLNEIQYNMKQLEQATDYVIGLNHHQNQEFVRIKEKMEEQRVLNLQLEQAQYMLEANRQQITESSNLVRTEVEALRFEVRDLTQDVQRMKNTSKSIVQGYKGGVTCVQVGQFLMGIPSEEWRLAMYLSRYGAFEYGTEKCFCNYIREGMTVLDVGANLGIFTLHALSRGCNVYSFEPTPNTYHLLHENVWVNGFIDSDHVHLNQCAVGAAQGECKFTVYSDLCGHNSMFGVEKENSELITVPVIALDETFAPGTRIDAIKIDVEGAEPLVFEGMQRIIQENEGIKIFMEFAPEHLNRAGYVPKEFLEKIEGMGLSIQIIDENNGEIIETEKESLLDMVSVNLLLSR